MKARKYGSLKLRIGGIRVPTIVYTTHTTPFPPQPYLHISVIRRGSVYLHFALKTSMGDKENCVRITRASKKRAFGNAVSDITPNLSRPDNVTPKRVVLGDIINSPSFSAVTRGDQDFAHTLNPKFAPQSKEIIEERADEIVKPGIDFQESEKAADAPLIYRYLRQLEVEEDKRPVPNYMEKVQGDITPAMREVLVDWLVEVADEYKLVSDTLYRTVNFIDRFLSSRALCRTRLQLLGVSSMLVASKFEEITPPHVEDFCYMTDNTYTKKEVMEMELDLLQFLNYEMGYPTTRTFIRIFIRAAQDSAKFSSIEFEFLACYISELSLLDYTCVRFLPSMIAASAIFLARFTILPSTCPWTLALQQFTGYASHQLKECVLAIHHLQSGDRETSGRAVREKYTEHKFESVAAWCPPLHIPNYYFL